VRTLLSMSFVLGCSVIAAVHGQTGTAAPPAGSSSSQTTTADAHTPANAPVTVTGCLRAGDQQNTFVLAVLDPAGGDTARNDTTTGAQSPAPTGTAGTAGQSSAVPKTVTYQLVPSGSSIDLRSHVGQRVQVSGKVQPNSGTNVAAQSRSAGTAPTDTAPNDQATPVVSTTEQTNLKVQRLQVDSLKAVGGSCQ
jgi:hypothetical protein